jgi:hypothetical protein
LQKLGGSNEVVVISEEVALHPDKVGEGGELW